MGIGPDRVDEAKSVIFTQFDKSTRVCADTCGGCLGVVFGLVLLGILVLMFL